MYKAKVVRGAALIAVTTGLTLWNVESQEAVALAPVNTGHELATQAEHWSEGLSIRKDDASLKKVKKLKVIRKVRVKEHRIAVRKAKLEAARKKRMAQIEKRCGGKVSHRDRLILQRIVEAEAGDQDHLGKLLVANVILNRVCSKHFPQSITGVVFAPRQFSPIADGGYDRAVVSEDTRKAVDEALRGIDYSQGALYFMDRQYSASSNVAWFDSALTRLFKHQGHEFYK